jgi:hypothetical protein
LGIVTNKKFRDFGLFGFSVFFGFGGRGGFSTSQDAIRRTLITARLGHVLKVRYDIAILLL